jgi:putative heme-binding domain-containing protein
VTASLLAVAPVAWAAEGGVDSSEAARTALAVEALTRLQNVNLAATPALQEKVFKLLDKTRGTPDFLRLVRHFKLPGQTGGLLELASNDPAGETGVEALRLVLDGGETAALQAALAPTNAVASRLIEALGHTGDRRAVEWLLPLTTDPAREGAQRRQAVRALARTREGAGALLRLARERALPEELKFTAAGELARARWPEIQAEAATLLPPPQGREAQPLPPVSELARRTGDPANGLKVFNSLAAGCATCHQVNGQGIDFGPNLSEIGTKLGKDALYDAILDPSAGISFGYEAWTFELKSGDEAYGLLASETADEVAVKSVGGLVARHKKSDVTARRQSKLSIMPSGLQQSVSLQELIDLVEYLATLKKAEGAGRAATK